MCTGLEPLLLGSAASAATATTAATAATTGLFGTAGAFSLTSTLGTIFSALPLVASAVGTSAENTAIRHSGDAQLQAGRDRQAALESEAAQAEQIAGQERAVAQRRAAEQRRQAKLVESRSLAVAAGSGAGASGGNVETILGDIGAEGEFRALYELFEGEERARNLEHQARTKVFEGGLERRAGEVAYENSRLTARANTFTSAATGLARYGQSFSSGFKSSFSAIKQPPLSSHPNPTLAMLG